MMDKCEPATEATIKTSTLASASSRVHLLFKWRGENYRFPHVDLNATSLDDLKEMIEDSTSVISSHQRIMNLTKKLKPDGATLLSDLGLKIKDETCSFTLMGTPESEITEMHAQQAAFQVSSTVFDDLAFDLSSNTEEWQKLQEYTAATKIQFMHAPRQGKGLLVLDLDHTIVHFTSKENIPIEQQKRPHMDIFMEECYKHYDIAIWSQTRWHWIEIKMNEMNMFNNPNYKVCFILDKTSMFNGSRGKVKPLHLIWSKYPDLWGKHNTVHIDDLARNFQLNRQNGIVIRPFNRIGSSAATKAAEQVSKAGGGGTAVFPAPLNSFPAPFTVSSTTAGTTGAGTTGAGTVVTSAAAAAAAAVLDPTIDIDLLLLCRYLIRMAEKNVDVSTEDHSNWFTDAQK